MCGILGVISQTEIDRNDFIRMRDTMIHRGPDDEGDYFNPEKKIALGHRRLSIIDLSEFGKQPISNEDGSIWITFNGEIYNFKEIKEKLIKLGHSFKSSTDTEVIVHGYEEWGVEILKQLRGMFSFGIWDENEKKMFLARDRVGIKPLYYFYDGKKFIFASEIKAIIEDRSIPRKINPIGLKNFLKYTYIPSPFSIWDKIYKLPPGHFLIIKDNCIKITKFWDLKVQNLKVSEKEVFQNTENYLRESIKYRFVSDVPVGTLLSGGIDSSLITALSSEINSELLSFSVGFEPKEYSELDYARIIAKKYKTKSIERILSSSQMDHLLDKVLYHYDEPLGVSSVFPTLLLMESVSQNVKVVLSGDGGDEIFAGYSWYTNYLKNKRFYYFSRLFKLLYKITSSLEKRFQNKILKIASRKIKYFSSNDLERYRMLTTPRFEDHEIESLINKDFHSFRDDSNYLRKYAKNGLRTIKDLQIFDFYTFLVDSILVKVDRASMAYSLEVRVPFLDHFLIEYVMNLNRKIIFKHKKKKYILKKISLPYLPLNIIDRPKKGFSAPMDKLGIVNNNLYLFKNALTVKDGIFNKEFIFKIIQSKNNAKIWLLILFELWYRKWKT